MTTNPCESPTLEVVDSENYNPNHPDADWSGFVSSRSQRKHVPSQPNQLCAVNSHGLGPKEDVATADWTKPARKIVHQVNHQSSTFSLIGGPVPAHNPDLYSPGCWETEAQAAARKRKTDLQQLTVQGRSKYIKGKKRCSLVENEVVVKDVHNVNDQPRAERNESSKMAGFRSNTIKLQFSDPTFLKGVGDAMEKLRSPNAPYATDTSAPFDPYRTATGERRKDLLMENFRSVVPGYTGKRTCIN